MGYNKQIADPLPGIRSSLGARQQSCPACLPRSMPFSRKENN